MNTRRRPAALFVAALTAGVVWMAPCRALAQEVYPPDGDHPLRIVDYFVAPLGTALEWTVTRPLWRFGSIVAPYQHIDYRGFRGCNKERPSRLCTNVVK